MISLRAATTRKTPLPGGLLQVSCGNKSSSTGNGDGGSWGRAVISSDREGASTGGFRHCTQRQRRGFANLRNPGHVICRDVWFTSTQPRLDVEDGFPGQGYGAAGGDHRPPDGRTLKLGKTVRILHERLPTLLASPLPQEILSPSIRLHLFPSTHPHLPTVSGRLAYLAALWTSPIAWGRVPVVGNVKLIILSERMMRSGTDFKDEKLVVKWKTCGKTKNKGTGGLYRGIGASEHVDKITELLGGEEKSDQDEFCGLFMFEFDEQGRIAKHVIEHVEEGGDWEAKTGKVVSVTDWLLGRWNGKGKEEGVPGLAWCENGDSKKRFDRRPSGQ
ncbi:hypothetical protein AAFC00_005153 [Neodothiora populina]|uniref:Uncharacterized protein n=1 Tax=Neodothiora populina TaxID=2781224 RepID=A0ABR3PK59_9PEZI